MDWLAVEFDHPTRVELATGHHLRPIRESDVDIDYPAVMASRVSLWARYGEPWGWPPATMTFDEDRADLARHEREIAAHESFNYAVFDEDETELLGCVYIDPPEADSPPGTDAIASWWVVDDHAGGPLHDALDEFVPRWLADAWGFTSVAWVGMPGPLVRWTGVCIDCSDAEELAQFYCRLLGWDVTARDGLGWVQVRNPAGGVGLNFQAEEWYRPPAWPEEPDGQDKMLHFEIEADDLDAAVALTVSAGGMPAPHQPADRDETRIRVMLDPAGHPFCLFVAGE